jgi:hypothetical protein
MVARARAIAVRRPPRQVISKENGDLLSRTIADHPVGSLTTIGVGIGTIWGGAAGLVLGTGAAKVGAAIGGLFLGARGYSIGKDLESWLIASK